MSDTFSIQLINAGKRFNREWIFKNIDFTFSANNIYAVTGPNGSGKSTLLQTIAGNMNPSEGSLIYSKNNTTIKPEEVYDSISICAPYLEVIEEMTATEFLHFHKSFKPLIADTAEILEAINLTDAANKQIRNYSSGMKQRVKLAQAIFSKSDCVLLDEPCTNLDTKGYDTYYSLINKYAKDRIIIVCSNDEKEISVCNQSLDITQYKKSAA